MLKVEKIQQANKVLYQLSGSIDENDDLNALLEVKTAILIIYTKNIEKINSMGVKAWIKFFSSLTERKVSVVFEAFAIPCVEQASIISNFTCGGEVRSLCVPFSCTTCGEVQTEVLTVSDLQKSNFLVDPIKCTKCGNPSEFDDVPEAYFAFLRKK